MKPDQIIGRDFEKTILNQAVKSPDPEFIAVYGRRRVGKTYLIREYFKNSISFGIKDNAYAKELVANSLTIDDLF